MWPLETYSNIIWIEYNNSHSENEFDDAGRKMVSMFFQMGHVASRH